MIPKDKEYRLIKIYMYICDMYEQSLKYHCQRYSKSLEKTNKKGQMSS